MSVCCWMPAASATRCHKFLNRLSLCFLRLPPQTRLHSISSPTKFEVLPAFCYSLSQFYFNPLNLQNFPSPFQVQSGRRKNRATKSTKSLQVFCVISKSSSAADEDDDAAAAPFIGSSDTTPFSLSRDFTLHYECTICSWKKLSRQRRRGPRHLHLKKAQKVSEKRCDLFIKDLFFTAAAAFNTKKQHWKIKKMLLSAHHNSQQVPLTFLTVSDKKKKIFLNANTTTTSVCDDSLRKLIILSCFCLPL